MSISEPTTGNATVTSNPTTEAIASFVAMCLWLGIFALGTFIGTKPYRDTLAGDVAFVSKAWAFLVILVCYTATNTAMLCSIAAVMGGLFRRMKEQRKRPLISPSLLVLLFSHLLQGFIVYLLMVSGVVSFGGLEHFLDAPTQEQYLRLAATMSLVSFVIGYSPGVLNRLMDKLEKWAQMGTVGQTAPEAK